MIHRQIRNRQGASLLEVLLATAVLLISIAALSTQMMVGVRSANRINLQTISISLCRSVLAEQLSARNPTSVSTKRVDGFSDWMVQTKIEPVIGDRGLLGTCEREQMILVSVTAWQEGRYENVSKTTLSQIVRRQIKSDSVSTETPGAR